MTGPDQPIGTELAATARALARSFEAGLAAGGASRPTWLVLDALACGPAANQRELAAAVGIQDATLTHHLTALEAGGLVTRRRDPADRRVQLVEPTAAGRALAERLRAHAAAHDRRICAGFRPDELATLRALLARLRANAEDDLLPGPG